MDVFGCAQTMLRVTSQLDDHLAIIRSKKMAHIKNCVFSDVRIGVYGGRTARKICLPFRFSAYQTKANLESYASADRARARKFAEIWLRLLS